MWSIFEDILGRQGWAERPALLGQGACTYGQLLKQAEELAAVLTSLGITSPAVAALCVPPSPAYPVAMLAAYLSGLTLVTMNPGAANDEKRHVAENSGARFLITTLGADKTEPWFASRREAVWGDVRVLQAAAEPDVEPPRSGTRFLVYTSGSTSRPKGVILSDRAISSNVRAIVDSLALGPGDSSIVFTPPAYTYAISQTLTHLWAGASFVAWPHGMMYPAKILQMFEELSLTGLACNPTLMRMFLATKLSKPLDLLRVRYVKSAGQPLYSQLAREMSGLFSQARILCTYGCTENSPRICHHWLPIDLPDRTGPWPPGWPLQGVDVRIAGANGEGTAPIGESGEILIRGTSLMDGYWREPQLTAERMKDGWFLTGDLGSLDADGRLSVLGRIDNIIGVGHEKVSPEEIEAVLSKVEGIADVAITGQPDPLLDKVAVALIVADGNVESVRNQAIRACRAGLSAPKQPRHYYFVSQIPKTTYGKIDRKAVARLAAEQI
jgi:long-chain acyl-CoA synthetase